MGVLLKFSNVELGQVLAQSLLGFFEDKIQSVSEFSEMSSFLAKKPDAIVVTEESDLYSPGVLELFMARQTPVILLKRKEDSVTPQELNLIGAFSEKNLLSGVSDLLTKYGIQPKSTLTAAEAAQTPFVRVGTPLLTRSNPLLADVYIKLTELKFVKIFSRGDTFTEDDLSKYFHQKNIKFFYIKKADASGMTDHLSNIISTLLNQSPIPKGVAAPLAISTTETIHDLVRQVGFTPEIQSLVKKNVSLVIAEMAKTPTLADILKNMELNKDKYIASHSHMLAGISCMLAASIEWGSEITFKKLTMASLLHDMCITNDALCRVKSIEELNSRRDEFSLNDAQEYRSHPRRASVLIQGMKEIPADVDRIVYQHHESQAGPAGFPEGISPINIHPLATVLMASHEVVDWVIDHDGKFDADAFCNLNAERYRSGHFKLIFKEIKKLKM